MNLRSKYHEFTLPNGLKVCLFKMPSVMSVYANLSIRVGAIDEAENLRGISHFLEHAAFHGTEKLPSHKDIAEYTENHGIRHMAATGNFVTYYMAKFPDNEIDNGIDFLHQLVFKPLYRYEDIEKEKGVILSEYNGIWSNPDRKFSQKVSENRFKGNPHIYARRPVGVPDIFMNLKPDQLMEWKNKYYCANNMLLVLAGNITLQKAKGLISNRFGKEKSGKHFEQPTCKNEEYSDYKLYLQPEDRDQIGFELTFPQYGTKNKSREDRIRAYCFFRSLGGCTSSRIFQRIRNKERLAYSVGLTSTLFKHLGFLSIYGSSTKDNIKKVLIAIKEEIDLAVKNGITKSEFDISRNSQKCFSRMAFESPDTVAEGIIRQVFDTDQEYWLPEDEESFLSQINIDEVNSSIKGIFDYSKLNINLIGKLNSKEVEEIEKIFKK